MGKKNAKQKKNSNFCKRRGKVRAFLLRGGGGEQFGEKRPLRRIHEKGVEKRVFLVEIIERGSEEKERGNRHIEGLHARQSKGKEYYLLIRKRKGKLGRSLSTKRRGQKRKNNTHLGVDSKCRRKGLGHIRRKKSMKRMA